MIKTCPNCQKVFKAKGTVQTYCCRECANSSPTRKANVSKGRKAYLSTDEGKSTYKNAMKKRNEQPYYQRRETKRTRERDIEQGRAEYKQWRNTVIRRDNYTCQKCGKRGGILQAHHIKEWSKHPELRYDVNNGITYCLQCHSDEHGYWIHTDKQCPICGKRYIPHRMEQICCSNACAIVYRKQNQPPQPTYTCQTCKKKFQSNMKRKFCSNECYHESMRTIKDKTCKCCGKTFTPFHADGQYCSRKCYFKDRRK